MEKELKELIRKSETLFEVVGNLVSGALVEAKPVGHPKIVNNYDSELEKECPRNADAFIRGPSKIIAGSFLHNTDYSPEHGFSPIQYYIIKKKKKLGVK